MSAKLKQKNSLLKVGAFVFACMFVFNAQAGTVNNTLDLTRTEPDIISDGIATNYDNSTNEFIAAGVAVKLAHMGTDYAITGGEFIISGDGTLATFATINPVSGIAEGLLKITGAVSSSLIATSTGTLLTGTLAQVGGPGLALNFIFNVTGGDASVLYGGIGAEVGVIMGLTGYDGALNGFNSAFNTFAAVSDTHKIPVPNTIALLLIGFAALNLRRQLRA